MSTLDQFDSALSLCRDIFSKKLRDYGASWRIMRPRSITDQLYIKAKRIRTLEEEEAMVNEGVLGEFMAIINYGLMVTPTLPTSRLNAPWSYMMKR